MIQLLLDTSWNLGRLTAEFRCHHPWQHSIGMMYPQFLAVDLLVMY